MKQRARVTLLCSNFQKLYFHKLISNVFNLYLFVQYKHLRKTEALIAVSFKVVELTALDDYTEYFLKATPF